MTWQPTSIRIRSISSLPIARSGPAAVVAPAESAALAEPVLQIPARPRRLAAAVRIRAQRREPAEVARAPAAQVAGLETRAQHRLRAPAQQTPVTQQAR